MSYVRTGEDLRAVGGVGAGAKCVYKGAQVCGGDMEYACGGASVAGRVGTGRESGCGAGGVTQEPCLLMQTRKHSCRTILGH